MFALLLSAVNSMRSSFNFSVELTYPPIRENSFFQALTVSAPQCSGKASASTSRIRRIAASSVTGLMYSQFMKWHSNNTNDVQKAYLVLDPKYWMKQHREFFHVAFKFTK